MTHGSLTKLLRLLSLNVLLTLPLSGCLPTSEKVVAPPPPQTNEKAKAICAAWATNEPTWEDNDAEATKDSIDLNIRTREMVCVV